MLGNSQGHNAKGDDIESLHAADKMIYDLKDEEQAKEYINNLGIEYSYQCYKEKNPEGCHRLADYFEGIKKEFQKASEIYKNNCDNSKYGYSCFKFANCKMAGKGTTKDPDSALDYYLKACDVEYVPACHKAALLLHNKKVGSVKDPERAVKLLKYSCKYDYAPSCFQLSGWFINGTHSITKDMAQAFEFSKKACDMGNCYGCGNLSQMYKKGEGVAKDEKLAEKYRLKAKQMYEDMVQAQRTITMNE